MDSSEHEANNRMREHANKLFAQRWGRTPEKDAVILQAMKDVQKAMSLTMEVVNTAKDQGHPFDPERCTEMLNKFLLDQFCKWNKDDLLVILTQMQAETLFERIDELNNQGMLGSNVPDLGEEP